MSYCQLCQLFGAWLLSKEVADAVKFYRKNRYDNGWMTDGRLRLNHHQGDAEAAEAGCPLCNMLVQLHVEAQEENEQTSLQVSEDSVTDWQQESAAICSIYSNAVVNIAAASARNEDEGFLSDRMSPTKVSDMIATDSLDNNVWIRPSGFYKSWFEDGFLAHRGWCYQERMLATRTLIFRPHELLFRCREYHLSESHPLHNGPPLFALEFWTNLANGQGEYQRRNNFSMWQQIVVPEYSRRSLTFPEDKIPALSSLASQFGGVMKDRYLAGLWESDLPAAVCLVPSQNLRNVKTSTVPSWSWASHQGKVFYSVALDEMEWEASVLSCDIDQVSGAYGQVQGGCLRLEGRLLPINLVGNASPSNVTGQIEGISIGESFRLDDELERCFPRLISMLLGFQTADAVFWRPTILLLRQIARTDDFERIGMVNSSFIRRVPDVCGIERKERRLPLSNIPQ
jgi:hypothetical protein